MKSNDLCIIKLIKGMFHVIEEKYLKIGIQSNNYTIKTKQKQTH